MSDDERPISSPSPVSTESSDSNDEPSTQKPVDNHLCEVCCKEPSKYTCPRCEIKSCCLTCVKDHKTRLDCSGERNKTEFVSMSEYSDRHLLNDYRFLEDAGRTLYTHKAVPQNRQAAVNTAPYHHNKRSKLLMTAAGKRGIRLKMVSGALKKHRSNTSFYTISTDKIDWHIEWCFAASGCLIHHERVPESQILFDAAQKYMNPVNFPHLRKPLEVYRKEGLTKSRFLLKVEGLPANRQRYFQLNPSETIGSNLNGHSLIEHPSIFILPESCTNEEYPLLSRDDFPFMDEHCRKHVARNHPAFKYTDTLKSQVLDPNSHIYKVEESDKVSC